MCKDSKALKVPLKPGVATAELYLSRLALEERPLDKTLHLEQSLQQAVRCVESVKRFNFMMPHWYCLPSPLSHWLNLGAIPHSFTRQARGGGIAIINIHSPQRVHQVTLDLSALGVYEEDMSSPWSLLFTSPVEMYRDFMRIRSHLARNSFLTTIVRFRPPSFRGTGRDLSQKQCLQMCARDDDGACIMFMYIRERQTLTPFTYTQPPCRLVSSRSLWPRICRGNEQHITL